VAAAELELSALSEDEQAAGKRRPGIEPDQRFRANVAAFVGSEQWMAACDASHFHARRRADHSADECRFDPLDPAGIRAESLLSNHECNGRRIDPEHFRPIAGDDEKKPLDRRSIDCGKSRGMDRGDRPRMAPREGNEILVRLLDRPETLAEPSDRPLFELDQLSHARQIPRNSLISCGDTSLRGVSSLRLLLEGKKMLSAVVSLVSGAVVAATPVTPLPWFEFEDYPMKAFEKKWEGVTRFELLVGPDGAIAECRITSSSGHEELDKTTCALATRRVTFRPARADDGSPMWGTYRSQAIWALPERQIVAPPAADLEVSLNKLPSGTKEPPAVKLAYAVDSQGNPSSCTVMPSSLPQPRVLVDLGCKELLDSARGKPVVGPNGQPIPAVKTGSVLFKAGS